MRSRHESVGKKLQKLTRKLEKIEKWLCLYFGFNYLKRLVPNLEVFSLSLWSQRDVVTSVVCQEQQTL